MSRSSTVRNSRTSATLEAAGVLCFGIALVGGLLLPPASAQRGRAGFAQRTVPAPRPAPHTAQNEIPQRPTGRPVPQSVKPQVVQPRQNAPQNPNPQANQRPTPQRPMPQVSASTTPLVTPNRPGQTQQHLSDWMEVHRNLPLAEQQRALDNEPGFKTLNPQLQQQLHQRLTQLNGMAPEQRQRLLERTEAMERLAPVQRQQVRNAMAELGSIPEERRHIVSREFYQLRDMTPEQRQAYMNSAQYQGQFNEQERGAISSLLNVTPIYAPLQAQSNQPR